MSTTTISGVEIDLSFMAEEVSPMTVFKNFAKQWAEHRYENAVVSHEVRISSIGTSRFREECLLGLIQRFPDYKETWEWLFTMENFSQEVARLLYSEEKFRQYRIEEYIRAGHTEEIAKQLIENSDSFIKGK